jgi:hypothetical protein
MVMMLLLLLALWLGSVLFVCFLLGRERHPAAASGGARHVHDKGGDERGSESAAALPTATASDDAATGSNAA